MTTYEVLVAVGRDPSFDWRADGLERMQLGPRVAAGLGDLLTLVRAIESGRLAGRQVGWGGWVAPVGAGRLTDVLVELGWPAPDGLDDAWRARPCFLVGIES